MDFLSPKLIDETQIANIIKQRVVLHSHTRYT
jgi:hypothetical protein